MSVNCPVYCQSLLRNLLEVSRSRDEVSRVLKVEAIGNYKMCRKRKEGLYLVKWWNWPHDS